MAREGVPGGAHGVDDVQGAGVSVVCTRAKEAEHVSAVSFGQPPYRRTTFAVSSDAPPVLYRQVWEGALTFLFMPVLVLVAYLLDIGPPQPARHRFSSVYSLVAIMMQPHPDLLPPRLF